MGPFLAVQADDDVSHTPLRTSSGVCCPVDDPMASIMSSEIPEMLVAMLAGVLHDLCIALYADWNDHCAEA